MMGRDPEQLMDWLSERVKPCKKNLQELKSSYLTQYSLSSSSSLHGKHHSSDAGYPYKQRISRVLKSYRFFHQVSKTDNFRLVRNLLENVVFQ